MDAVKFLKEKIRMCNSFEGCVCCPLESDCGDTDPELMVKDVEDWSQAHPQKTIMQEFFEKFPNALKDSFGNPVVCPQALGYGDFCCDDTKNNCTVCWSRPLEE